MASAARDASPSPSRRIDQVSRLVTAFGVRRMARSTAPWASAVPANRAHAFDDDGRASLGGQPHAQRRDIPVRRDRAKDRRPRGVELEHASGAAVGSKRRRASQ